MNKKTIVTGLIAVAIIGSAASYASPYWTMRQMKAAIDQKNADAFSSHVDFPALRESLRVQFTQMMQSKMGGGAATQGNGFAALGVMMATSIVNQLIEAVITPTGVMTMMDKGTDKPAEIVAAKKQDAQEAQQTTEPGAKKQQADYSVKYINWSTVTATTKEGANEQVSFVFKRDGLWSWKLAGVALPVERIVGK